MRSSESSLPKGPLPAGPRSPASLTSGISVLLCPWIIVFRCACVCVCACMCVISCFGGFTMRQAESYFSNQGSNLCPCTGSMESFKHWTALGLCLNKENSFSLTNVCVCPAFNRCYS